MHFFLEIRNQKEGRSDWKGKVPSSVFSLACLRREDLLGGIQMRRVEGFGMEETDDRDGYEYDDHEICQFRPGFVSEHRFRSFTLAALQRY